MDLVSRTLSPRGFKIFYGVAFPLFAFSGYQIYTQSGVVWSLLIWAAEAFGPGDGKISAKVAIVLLIVPVMAIAAAAAYLHDYVCKLGVFAPKQAKPKRPHDPMRDW
jgi:hypothetical protein